MKLLILLLLPLNLLASPKNLDQLLKKVIEQRSVQQKELKEREQEFQQKKNQQSSLLKKAQAELRALEKITTKLTNDFESNEKDLAVLEQKLNIAAGTLGEMFGVVKQTAGDFKGQFQNSIISAQFKGRDAFMADLAEKKKLPGIEQLEKLWFEIQKEMTESGKVIKFKTLVVLPDGTKKEQIVTRVGSFNLVSEGKYLNFQGATNQLIELPRQPQGKFLSMAEDLEAASEVSAFGIDPSRGAILSMLVQAPSLMERLEQGGLVGYVILTLLLIGLIIVAERMITLKKEDKKIQEQLKSNNVIKGNPLGKLMEVFKENKDKDLETLEIKMDETIIKALPTFEKRIPIIKILSAVAPLLGLLGTVTGMIATFQSITLFGTGDPKLMAGGISTALITTVLGLICAIPLLLLHNLVASKSKNLIQVLEEQSAGYLAMKSEQK